MNTDISSARVESVQGTLFPPAPRDVCTRIGLNWWAAIRLYETEWLSFDPGKCTTLEEDQEAELVFVGSLVAGGCDDAMLKQMLAGLERPYRYRSGRIYYDWPDKTWRLLPVETAPPPPDEVFSDWLDQLVEYGNIDAIRELKELVLAAEKACKLVQEGAGHEKR